MSCITRNTTVYCLRDELQEVTIDVQVPRCFRVVNTRCRSCRNQELIGQINLTIPVHAVQFLLGDVLPANSLGGGPTEIALKASAPHTNATSLEAALVLAVEALIAV